MIDPQDAPPVDDDESLARFILHSNHFRNGDGTVTHKLFMPYKLVALSVNRHLDCTEQELWKIAIDVAKSRQCTLYGRTDIQASACRIDSLDVVPAVLPGNPNHADVIGYPPKKEDQQSLAIKLAARASKRITPPA